MTEDQPRGLIREVADLMQSIQQQQHPDRKSVLAELTLNSVTAMPGAQCAGITLSTRDGKIETPSSSNEYPALLDEIQQRHEQGPCLSAAWEHHRIRIDNMEAETRWPHYCRDALRETPIRAVVSYQLYSDHNQMGAMNFYADKPNAFDEDALEMGYILASHVAVAWSMVRRDEQFRSALASRDIIGQAKGMIMERFKIDAVQAFELLKRLSQSSNNALALVARELVESERYT